MTLKEHVSEIQDNSYVLTDLAKCLDLIIEEGDLFEGPRSALAGVVFERAKQLSEQLGAVQ